MSSFPGSPRLAKGGIANNLTALVADPNVSIHESKALMCNVRKRTKNKE